MLFCNNCGAILTLIFLEEEEEADLFASSFPLVDIFGFYFVLYLCYYCESYVLLCLL